MPFFHFRRRTGRQRTSRSTKVNIRLVVSSSNSSAGLCESRLEVGDQIGLGLQAD